MGANHPLSGDERAVAIAVVHIDEKGNTRFEVGVSAGHDSNWQRHDLAFSPNDPPLERWKATGFLVASLVAGERAFAKPAS